MKNDMSDLEKPINVCIVHYNTPFMTECLVKSINKFTPGCNIFIFDNSDKEPFVNTFDNVTVFDNTKGSLINIEELIKTYPNRFLSGGKANNWGSAKHCISIQKCIELIDDNFVLMDSDVLIKRDFSDIIDDNYISCGGTIRQSSNRDRVSPFICYLNVKKMKEMGVTYFDEGHMHGLHVNKVGDDYDTGAWLYEEIHSINQFKEVNIWDYIFHYAGGSWHKTHNCRIGVIRNIKFRPANMTPNEWVNEHYNLWNDEKIIITLTTWPGRIKNIPTVLDSIYNQTLLPNKIVLNLSSEEFSDRENSIGSEVASYINSHNNILINWVDGPNTRQWKKILPTFELFPNDILINIDDDKIYEASMIETLFKAYLENPNNPICGGNCVFKGLQCHTGPCSLIKAKFFEGYKEYFNDKDIYNMHSSDIFFTYLANKNGYRYVYCGYNFEYRSKKFNEYKPMHLEKTGNTSKLIIMWEYLTKKYGTIKPMTIARDYIGQKTENRVKNIKREGIVNRKHASPPRPMTVKKIGFKVIKKYDI